MDEIDMFLYVMPAEKINDIFLGLNLGFFCLGLLFYIIRLTGPLKSLTSLLYLVTIISFASMIAFDYLLSIYGEEKISLLYAILVCIFANCSVSYFGILVANTHMIIERKWLYLLCVLPTPSAVSTEIWGLEVILSNRGIHTGINLYAVGLVTDLLVVITQFIINFTCYLKFIKYKQLNGFSDLLNQYLSGIVSSLVFDIITRFIAYYFEFDHHKILQICTASAFINLNLEYFLLNRIRNVLMSELQMYNS